MEANEIYNQAAQAVRELIGEDRPHFNPVRLLVVGCSSSEIAGGVIGHESTYEYGDAVARAVLDQARKMDFAPAFQCCEHLNRALILEQEAAEKFGYEPVNVRPWAHAGGSFATTVWENLEAPCAVEHIRAKAGMDIGDTLIGMHLKEVAVPVRLGVKKIGQANLVCARTRPRFIGGERARYQEELK